MAELAALTDVHSEGLMAYQKAHVLVGKMDISTDFHSVAEMDH